MQILFVTNMWPERARPWFGTFVKAEAESLRKLGAVVDVIYIRGWASRSDYVSRARDVLRLNLRSASYDVVHAHYGHAGVLARLQFRSPLVIGYYGGDLLGTYDAHGGRPLRGRIETSTFRQIARLSAATITQSEEMEQRLPRVCRGRNFVVPSSVDLERFRPRLREQARKELGWPPNEETVLFIGDPAVWEKNHPLALEVMRIVARTRPRAKLRVATRVSHEHVPMWMNAADALLFTSRSEGSPNAVREAMATALPIVSTPVGDVEERLRGVDACFIRPPEAGALAASLVEALDYGRAPQAREAMIPFGFQATAQRLLDVYEFAIGRAARRHYHFLRRSARLPKSAPSHSPHREGV